VSEPERGGYVMVVPWYDRSAFAEICTASPSPGVARDYDRWRDQATQAIERLLRQGKMIEIVTIRPAEYRAWLSLHAHCDSPLSRQRFVRELALG